MKVVFFEIKIVILDKIGNCVRVEKNCFSVSLFLLIVIDIKVWRIKILSIMVKY